MSNTFHVEIGTAAGEPLANAHGDVEVISYVAKRAALTLDNAPAADEFTVKLTQTDRIGGSQVGDGPIVNITANGEVATMVLKKRLTQLRKWARPEVQPVAAGQEQSQYETV